MKNQKIKKSKNQNCGQSMFEVILALFIITLIIVAVVILSTTSISNSLASRNKTLASKYTQEAVEWLRKEKEVDYLAFKNRIITNSTYCLSTLAWVVASPCPVIANTNFVREAEFSSELLNNKTIITVNVVTSWNDSKGIHESRTVTYFTDIKEQ